MIRTALALSILTPLAFAQETAVGAAARGRPQESIQKAGKQLCSTEGYSLEYRLKIGEVAAGSNEIARPEVVRSFRGRVHRGVLEMQDESIFLGPRGGAAWDGDSKKWVALGATGGGREIENLVRLPEEHLAVAFRNAARAEWVGGTIRIPIGSDETVRKALQGFQNSGCAGDG